jgi:hypothetical protein
VSRANGHVYGATSRSDDRFYDFNPVTNSSQLVTVIDRVPVPLGWDSTGADVLPDGTRLISARNGDNTVLAYDANPANFTFGDVVATLRLAGGATFQGNDLAFNPKDGFAYSATGGTLYRYDFSTNPVGFTTVATNAFSSANSWSSVWFDEMGNFFVQEKTTGEIWQLDLSASTAASPISGANVRPAWQAVPSGTVVVNPDGGGCAWPTTSATRPTRTRRARRRGAPSTRSTPG